MSDNLTESREFPVFNPNAAGNPRNNIFGLPTTEADSRVVLVPVPWEVTVSYGAGTARCAEHICKASLQVDLFDPDAPDAWKAGYYMRDADRKIRLKSDYLRKEAELYIDYISRGENVSENKFMTKSLRDINEGSRLLNKFIYEECRGLLGNGKLVGLIGGDHSVVHGFYQALAEKEGEFGILQIDAHCDLRQSYEDFVYSHVSVMYNALTEIPQINRLVQVGARDYSAEEQDYISASGGRVTGFFDRDIRRRLYEGDTWKMIAEEIVSSLPDKVHVSLDVDGLDPKLCPNTGMPVAGGFEAEQVLYLVRKIVESGRRLIGFDVVEVGVGETEIDANIAATLVWRLCSMLVKSNS